MIESANATVSIANLEGCKLSAIHMNRAFLGCLYDDIQRLIHQRFSRENGILYTVYLLLITTYALEYTS